MKTINLSRLAAGVLALALGCTASAQENLTVASWGGAYTKSQEKAFFGPYAAASGTKIQQQEWDGSTARIKGMVDAGKVTWDVVDVEPIHALQGCEEGWLEKIDYARIGGKDKFVEGAAMDCAVGTILFGTIYAYDAARFPNGGPKTMADLWDVKKFPGARALQKSPKANLEFALIADGVSPKDVYKVLETKAGVDRAFRKLSELKPNVKVWWTDGAQPPKLLGDGEVALSTAWNGRIYDAVKGSGKDLRIVWDGQGLDLNLWAIPKGAKHLEAAKKFVEFTLKPEVMAQQSQYISYGPTVKAALAKVPVGVLVDLPSAPQNAKNSFVISAQFWREHNKELTDRFNKWLTQ